MDVSSDPHYQHHQRQPIPACPAVPTTCSNTIPFSHKNLSLCYEAQSAGMYSYWHVQLLVMLKSDGSLGIIETMSRSLGKQAIAFIFIWCSFPNLHSLGFFEGMVSNPSHKREDYLSGATMENQCDRQAMTLSLHSMSYAPNYETQNNKQMYQDFQSQEGSLFSLCWQHHECNSIWREEEADWLGWKSKTSQ